MRKMHSLGDMPGKPVYDKELDRILHQRFVALQYEDDDISDDSGGGSAQTALLSAAAQLGSAAIISQTQPNYTSAPQTARPLYGVSTTPSGGIILAVIVVAVIFGIFAFAKG
jgi:hypothetical protein